MVLSGPPPGGKLIWILGDDGKLAAYDSQDFHFRIRGLALPPGARQHPESISISRTGLVIYADLVPGTKLLHLWSTNRYAPELIGGTEDTGPAKDGGLLATSATPAVFFSADGERLFWFENKLSVVQREGEGDVSRTGEFLSWTTDLAGRNLQSLLSFGLDPCKCDTGACEETCPEISVWGPQAGISDFFFLTRWVPGQTSPDFLESDLYQAKGGVWVAHKLPGPVERFLDAADSGNTYMGAIPDAGCCGWLNESDDVTYLVHGGKQVTVFDERARFHNPDYDLSLLTSNAMFSPDTTQAAYTITATSKFGQPLRLSDEGKDNPDELRLLQAALKELPRVEVVALTDLSKPRLSLPNTELVGWLDAQRLLVWQEGQLFVIDSTSGQSLATPLKAEKAAWAFIR